jgi:pimeloyl-ACP methyl ester carboxylesterase
MIALLGWLLIAPVAHDPSPPGRLIDLGGHRLHVHCTGRGRPTVVIETGLGDFSFDWILVQHRLESTLRVCTYDRGGYAWSDPGPQPRTFDQLNLELHDALARAGERGPFVLVGHSFGGGPVRTFAQRYPTEVAGLVLVDIVSEQQYIPMGRHAGRIGDDAKGRAIPAPHEAMAASRAPAAVSASARPSTARAAAAIEAPYDRLPAREQRLHAWAAAQSSIEAAEDSQREWSAEYFARWAATSQKGILGALPLIVLTREHGGYGDDLVMPALTLERTRLDAQRALAELSSAGTQRLVPSGHNMHLEVPDAVAQAIRDVAAATHSKD